MNTSSTVSIRVMDLLGFLMAFAIWAAAIGVFWSFKAHIV